MRAVLQAIRDTQDVVEGSLHAEHRANPLLAPEALPSFAAWQQALDEECALWETCVDYIPKDLGEALDSFALAAELDVPGVANLMRTTKRHGRTLHALVALRRLEGKMMRRDDGCVPPRRLEARVLRSLIVWMARPVLI